MIHNPPKNITNTKQSRTHKLQVYVFTKVINTPKSDKQNQTQDKKINNWLIFIHIHII